MAEADRKRKERDSKSSVDELDTSTETEIVKAKQKKKNRRTEHKGNETTIAESETESQAPDTDIKNELHEINLKLAKMVTKDDSSLKDLIVSVIDQMKDSILQTIEKRVGILESHLFESQKENDRLKKEVRNLEQKLSEKVNDQNTKLTGMKATHVERINDIEQYGRRNNLVISGIQEATETKRNAEAKGETKEASRKVETANEIPEESMEKVISQLNSKLPGLNLKESEIDMCHRLGKNRSDKPRPIIVKFVSRMTKIKVLQRRKELQGTDLYINEDLTRINLSVLGTIKKKLHNGERLWTREGKLYLRNNNNFIRQIPFSEFKNWVGTEWESIIDKY